MYKRILIIASVIFILCLGFYWVYMRPFAEFNDMLQRVDVNEAHARNLAHKMLNNPFADNHDAYLTLVEVGNSDSVPFLINALRKEEHTEEGAGMICSKAHCLEALKKITKQDLGNNYVDWVPLLNKAEK